MKVVGHDRVGAGLDGEDVQQFGKSLLDPQATVVVLVAAEECAADASADAVIEAGSGRVDDAGARVSHAGLQRPELIVSAARWRHVTCSDWSNLAEAGNGSGMTAETQVECVSKDDRPRTTDDDRR